MLPVIGPHGWPWSKNSTSNNQRPLGFYGTHVPAVRRAACPHGAPLVDRKNVVCSSNQRSVVGRSVHRCMAVLMLLAVQQLGVAQDTEGLARLDLLRQADPAALLDGLHVHRHEAGGLWHFLLQHCISELRAVDATGQPDFPTRVAEALDQLLTTRAFSEDLVPLRHIPVRERAHRTELLIELAKARQVERDAHASADYPALLNATTVTTGAIAGCTAFAERFEDRELQRHLTLTEVARTRALPATAWKDRARALGRCTDLFQHHDLLADGFARLALIEAAALALQHDGAVLAESLLSSLGEAHDLPPFARAQLASLRAVLTARRGFDEEAAVHLDHLAGLFVQLKSAPLDTASRALLAEWRLQAADHLLRKQRNAEALVCVREAPLDPAPRAGIAARLSIVAARAALELGRLSEAHADAETALRAAVKISAAEPEAPLRRSLVVEVKVLRADLELRLQRTVTARATLASIDPEALSGAEPELRAERELVYAQMATVEGNLVEALAAVDNAIKVATTPAAADARIRALWAQSRLLAQLGEGDAAIAAAEDAAALAPCASRNPELCNAAARINLATILVSLGRLAEAEAQVPALNAPAEDENAHQRLARARILRLKAEIFWCRNRLNGESMRELAPMRLALADAVDNLAREKYGSASLLAPLDALEVLRGHLLLQELDLCDRGARSGEPYVRAAQSWLETIARDHPHLLNGPAGLEAPALVEALRARDLEARGACGDALDAWRRAARCETQLRAQMGLMAPDGLSMRFEFIHDRIAGLLLERAASLATEGAAREALLELDNLRARSLKIRRVMSSRGGTAGLTESLSWMGARRLLAAGRVVVAHALTTRGAFVLACSAERIACARIALDRDTLMRKLHVWRRSMEWTAAPFQTEVASSEGHALWKILFDPVAHVLTGAREICCLPPAELSGVPFAALLTQPFAPPPGCTDWSRAPFLVARRGIESVAEIPCLATLHAAPKTAAPAPAERVLLVADPVTSLPPLPGSRLEGDLFRRLYGDKASVLAGTAAHRGAVLDELRSSPTIIHFATHAVVGERGGSELALSGSDHKNARLRSADLRHLQLPSRPLVVLASCCSAASHNAGYEGGIGLPHAFLAAGARCVVAACMPVADTASATLLSGFYEELRAQPTRTPGAALCAVQRSCAATARTSWPGHWAPWLAFGHP